MIKRFSPKAPSEVVTLSIGYYKVAEPNEGAVSCTFQAFDYDTGVEDTTVLDPGPANISDWPIVRQRAVGGEDGKTYLIVATVTTNIGRVIQGRAKLPVCIGQ